MIISRLRMRLLGIIICSVLLPGQAISQQIRLDLQQTIDIARLRSLDSKVAEYAYKSGFWNFNAFRSGFYPAVSFSGTVPSYNHSIQRITLPSGQDIFVPSNQAYTSFNLFVTQQVALTGGIFSMYSSLNRIDLFGGGIKSHQYSTIPVSLSYSQNSIGYNGIKWQGKIAPLLFEESNRSYWEAQENISLTVISIFFNLLQAQNQYLIDAQNMASADTLLKITETKYQIGTRDKNDLLRARLNFMSALDNLTHDKVTVELNRQNFVKYLNLPLKDSVVLSIPDNADFFPVDPELALHKASENRQKVIEFRRRRLEAEQNLAAARSSVSPTIGINANIGYSQVNRDFKVAYSDLLNQQSVALQVNVPILNWGVNKARIKKARADLELAKNMIEQDEMAFENEILFQTMQWSMLSVQLNSAKEAKAIAMERFELVKQHYLANTIGFTEYDIALREKDAAINAYTDNLRNYWNLYFTLRKLTLFDFKTMNGLLKIKSPE